MKCPYCGNDCPRPILPGWYRCDWCDNHFLTKDSKKPDAT
jgi:CRISPR/Cas system-associated protein Cas10 (large subunit of type III CRISPR-Cas system)